MDRSTTDTTSGCHFAFEGESFHFISHLLAEFSGRGQHQGLSTWVSEINQIQNWQHKRCGFAGTCACLSDTIATRQGNGDKSGLNGTRCSKSGSLNREQRILTEPQIIKPGGSLLHNCDLPINSFPKSSTVAANRFWPTRLSIINRLRGTLGLLPTSGNLRNRFRSSCSP